MKWCSGWIVSPSAYLIFHTSFTYILIVGIFQTVVAICGIIGNTMAALILSSRKRAKNTFDSLCVSLTCFDSLYLIGCILQSLRLQFHIEAKVLLQLYPHLLYPMHQFAITGSIFMTVSIAFERYTAVHYPLDYNKASNNLL